MRGEREGEGGKDTGDHIILIYQGHSFNNIQIQLNKTVHIDYQGYSLANIVALEKEKKKKTKHYQGNCLGNFKKAYQISIACLQIIEEIPLVMLIRLLPSD